MQCKISVSPHNLDHSSSLQVPHKAYANIDGFASAQFVVKAGENKLARPVAGGVVKAGVLKSQVLAGNL